MDTTQSREILIQEDYLSDPWKMMVCCILLNQTNNKQVRPILSSVFELIPNPISTIGCDPKVLAAVIKTTGFQNVKADRIIKLSLKWIEGFDDVSDLPGIGRYGKDSWRIFVDGDTRVEPTDKKLMAYLEAINRPSN
jgi:methyl-CpG-binding domain protein 4